MAGLSEQHRGWLDSRGIDPAIAEQMGCSSRTNAAGDWMIFPHHENGRIVNRTLRRPDDEHEQRIENKEGITLINGDCLFEEGLNASPLLICQREIDMLSLLTAGKRRVVCLPHERPAGDDRSDSDLRESQRYSWFWRLRGTLVEVNRVVLCTDDTPEGIEVREELLRLFGPERCFFIEHPANTTTLNDIVTLYSHARLVEVIDAARAFPIQGLFDLSELPERDPVRGYPIGIPVLQEMIEIVPATLTIFTGYANSGKSTVLNSIIAASIKREDPVCIFSGETDVKPILRDHIRAAVMERHISDIRAGQYDTTEADALMERNLSIIMQDVDEDEEMDLDEFLRLAETAVKRKGVRLVVLDPWNEIEHKMRPGETVDQYISRAIRTIKRWMRRLNVSFWIVAHPKNPIDGVKRAPGLYDIAGGAMWANKADYGMTYHRGSAAKNEGSLAVCKVRMGLPGRRGVVKVKYNPWTSNFDLIDDGVPPERML